MIQYTYELAATEKHPEKKGVNRTSWEDNGFEDPLKWTEITREYLPQDPREQPCAALLAVLSAKPEEIEQIRVILGIK